MSRVIDSVPRVVFFLAGVAAAAVAHSRRERAGHEGAGTDRDSTDRYRTDRDRTDRDRTDRHRTDRDRTDSGAAEALKKSLAKLETRIQDREAVDAIRFARVEARLEENSAKLADVPSTSQIVSAMEQLLSRTMASLDERLTTQSHSIEVLRTTVSQTDGLLERVLESLDSLQSLNDSAELAGDPLLSRAAGA